MTLSLDEIASMTDPVDMQRQLDLLLKEEEEVEAVLSTVLSDDLIALDAHKHVVHHYTHDVSSLETPLRQMDRLIAPTAALATSLSQKVKQLDRQQSRVKATLQQVDDTETLMNTVSAVNVSMHSKAFDTAASHLATYLSFPAAFRDMVLQDVPSPIHAQNAAQFLDQSRRKLLEYCVQQMSDTTEEAKEEELLQMTKMLMLIGEEEEGVQRYTTYLAQQLRAQCRLILDHVHTSQHPFRYADALTRMFEGVAAFTDRQQATAQQHLPTTRHCLTLLLKLLETYQATCDRQALLLLDTMDDELQVTQTVKHHLTVRHVNANGEVAQAKDATAAIDEEHLSDTLRKVDALASQLSQITGKVDLYKRFLRIRRTSYLTLLQDQQRSAASPSTKNVDTKDKTTEATTLFQRVDDLRSTYVILEDFFLRQTVAKAIRIDQYETGEQTSSCVDDIFYICRKCLLRALDSMESRTFTAAINICHRALEEEFVTVFERKIKRGFADVDTKNGRFGIMILLNNMETSHAHLNTLLREIGQRAARVFETTGETTSVPKIMSVFTDTATFLKNLLQEALASIFASWMKPRLRLLLKELFGELKYNQTSETKAGAHRVNGLQRVFLPSIEKAISPYKRHLTHQNALTLYGLMLSYCVTQWEKFALQSTFSATGAIQFDKDVRLLMTTLFHIMPQPPPLVTAASDAVAAPLPPPREKFLRLLEMTALLTMDQSTNEKVEDVYDYIDPNATDGGSKLSVAELRQLLSRRFTTQDVARLRF